MDPIGGSREYELGMADLCRLRLSIYHEAFGQVTEEWK
jgi:hypothetical protein